MKKRFLPLKLSALTLLALATGVASCNHDKTANELPQPTQVAASDELVDQELDAVAKAFAQTLGSSADTRKLLKAEAEKQFDNDYDVLYTRFATQAPEFGQHLNEALGQDNGMSKVLTHVPYLNIAVPVNIAKWETASYSPLVTFVPAGFNEKTSTKPLKAYDKDGAVHWLDIKHAPDVPVVVLGPSERITDAASMANPTLFKKPFRATDGTPGNVQQQPGGQTTNLYPQPEEPISDDPGSGGGGGGGTPGPQYYSGCHVDKQTEYLRSLWMDDVSEYESWFLGGPEIVVQILVPAGLNTGTGGGTLYKTMYSMSRGAIEDTWYCDLDLFYWDKNVISDAVQFVWLEQDGGTIATEELTISGKIFGATVSNKVTFEIKNDDDRIGEKRLAFDQCPTSNYYTLGGGSTEFRWTMQSR